MSWRKIVVNETEFRWTTSVSGFVIRNMQTNKKQIFPFSWDDHMQITPGTVARLIRHHIFGEVVAKQPSRVDQIVSEVMAIREGIEPEKPPVVPKTVIYAVEVAWYDDDAGRTYHSIIEIHENPQTAIDTARKLNEEQEYAEKMWAEYYKPLRAKLDALDWKTMKDGEYRRRSDEIKAAWTLEFFTKLKVYDPLEQARLLNEWEEKDRQSIRDDRWELHAKKYKHVTLPFVPMLNK